MEKRSIFSLRTHHPGIVALLIALLILSGAFFFSTEVEASSQATTKTIGGCPLFPTNNVWNYDISHVPVSGKSATYLASIGLSGHLHPDFGSGLYDGEPMLKVNYFFHPN